MEFFKVDYDLDIKMLYEKLFAAEYEKANIWPLDFADNGVQILDEEIEEVVSACSALSSRWEDLTDVQLIPRPFDLHSLEAHAVTTICELLQVIAVCRKYSEVFTEANDESE